MKSPVFSVIPQDTCTGCEACIAKCPVGALTMKADSEGFYYPDCNQSLCLHCEACVHACPVAMKPQLQPYDKKVFGAHAQDKAIVEASSSGGMFSLLAKKVIKEGGAIIGCRWKERYLGTEHICITRKEDLPQLYKSKYVQSTGLSKVYSEAEKYLSSKKKVLFCGTPCQVAGILQYIPEKLRENLITVDFICQGPTSEKAMKEFVQTTEKRKGRIRSLDMRYAVRKWVPYALKVEFMDGSSRIDRFYDTNIGAACRYMRRQSCGRCQFVGKGRMADITLGDFHHADETAVYYNERGTSVVIANSIRGGVLLDSLTEKECIMQSVDYQEIEHKNPYLSQVERDMALRHKFANVFTENGLQKAYLITMSPKQFALHMLVYPIRKRLIFYLQK